MFKVGDKVKLFRKPEPQEPFIWESRYDQFLGIEGEITSISRGIINGATQDLDYALIPKEGYTGIFHHVPLFLLKLVEKTCQCDLKILLAKGCKCGGT